MKTIHLTQGQIALVDDEDFPWLSQFKWQAAWSKHSKTWYARRFFWVPYRKKRESEFMHRRVMGIGPDFDIDHIDHNGLHNCKRNLRVVNKNSNGGNRRDQSKFGPCVQEIKSCKTKRYCVVVRRKKKKFYLGYFATAEEARAAREKFLRDNTT